ncbi:MAG: helix-turn-helix transcriptional regulator [Deltaproteobacteria bacterium]|nr:helix-turn-helix transcriptional regulator [Deltaproteobacteria bacterium]
MSDDFLKLDVGGKLRRLREDNGLSMADLARRAALPEAAVRDFEDGKAVPAVGDLLKMGNVLGVSIGHCARGVPHVQHAPGDRGGVHPRRARELHDVQGLLPPREDRGRGSVAAEEPGGEGAREVHDASPRERGAEDGGDDRALP